MIADNAKASERLGFQAQQVGGLYCGGGFFVNFLVFLGGNFFVGLHVIIGAGAAAAAYGAHGRFFGRVRIDQAVYHFIGANFVVTMQEKPQDVYKTVLGRLRAGNSADISHGFLLDTVRPNLITVQNATLSTVMAVGLCG